MCVFFIFLFLFLAWQRRRRRHKERIIYSNIMRGVFTRRRKKKLHHLLWLGVKRLGWWSLKHMCVYASNEGWKSSKKNMKNFLLIFTHFRYALLFRISYIFCVCFFFRVKRYTAQNNFFLLMMRMFCLYYTTHIYQGWERWVMSKLWAT